MLCPYCAINFHENWIEQVLERDRVLFVPGDNSYRLRYITRTAICPGPECQEVTIELGVKDIQSSAYAKPFRQILPIGSNRGPVPAEVPPSVAADYIEACNVLPISAKAAAALARRCLQSMLHGNGYKARDLAKEIDLLLGEADPLKALPRKLRETVDTIRNFGNFSAHPIDDKTSLQIIDVEPEEAEWCLETIEEMFEHFYVGPAESAAKKAALNAKLAAGGKPAAK